MKEHFCVQRPSFPWLSEPQKQQLRIQAMTYKAPQSHVHFHFLRNFLRQVIPATWQQHVVNPRPRAKVPGTPPPAANRCLGKYFQQSSSQALPWRSCLPARLGIYIYILEKPANGGGIGRVYAPKPFSPLQCQPQLSKRRRQSRVWKRVGDGTAEDVAFTSTPFWPSKNRGIGEEMALCAFLGWKQRSIDTSLIHTI